VSYPTAGLIQHRLMQAMAQREERYVLAGDVQVDDAYLGGEHTGAKAGRGSENKDPFLAEYGDQYLAAIVYRFDLRTLNERLLIAAATCGPRSQRAIRAADVRC
jgi:hypothetical protein